ncbi:MAG: hypothetical protein DCO96_15730 [Fluviicola sp. XM-24bin1]|nr:MAG: hypothetical protein DCO96_15730 [Fluviicola sp. XM-24bin1]
MKRLRGGLLVLMLMTVFQSSAQLQTFNEERLDMDQGLMLTLGSWATANLVAGGVGWATTPEGEAQYFHQMNFFWNTVNLALAVPGYLKARKESTDLTFGETLRVQNKTEAVFLINSGLDIGYMSAGLLLRSEARFNADRKDQWMGFGNSLLIQGGFLFVFDLTAYILHKRHFNKKLGGVIDQIDLSQNGIGLRWNIPNHPMNRYKYALL